MPIIAIDIDGLEEYYVIRWIDAHGTHIRSEITLRKHGENIGSPNINMKLSDNTSDRGAVFIYRKIGDNKVDHVEFGELNDTESQTPLYKMKNDNEKIYVNGTGEEFQPFSIWTGEALMSPPPPKERPLKLGSTYTLKDVGSLEGRLFSISQSPEAIIRGMAKRIAATDGISTVNVFFIGPVGQLGDSKIPDPGGSAPTVYENWKKSTEAFARVLSSELKKLGSEIKVNALAPIESVDPNNSGGFQVKPK